MAHEHEHDHGHEEVHFLFTDVTDGALAQIRDTNAPLAELLDITRRWGQATDDEKKAAAEKQQAVERAEGWLPGYHSEGDRCASCGMPTLALFADKFQEGELPYAAFLRGLPVHATRDCLDRFATVRKDASPRGLDKARRETMRDLERPTPRMSQFFRHDVLAQPPFELEHWANSVAEANPDGLDKHSFRDVEKCARWVHQRLFHH
ncbi:MAG TPA: hypothetical protein VFH78_13470 [Candidatus Thermoplasmatota archaeon]|nr:hypothetical protein [Candidatus Thermoplasmatota archaeon]